MNPAMRVMVPVLALLLTAGCSQLPVYQQASPAIVDAWIEQEQYGKAIDWLTNVSPEDPDYERFQAQLKQVEELAHDLERSTKKKATKHVSGNDWAAAQREYESALDKLPQSTVLQGGYEKLLARRDREMRKIAVEATIARAACLLNEVAWREKLVRMDPDDLTARWELDAALETMQQLVGRLLECSDEALSRGDLGMARRCIQQAKRMRPGAEQKASIAAAEKRVSAKETALRQKRERRQAERASEERQRRATELMRQVVDSMDNEELLAARKAMNELNSLVPGDPAAEALGIQLNTAVRVVVQQKIDEGSRLYREERIEAARRVWAEALALDPDNQEVATLVQRADRVLEKLQELKTRN